MNPRILYILNQSPLNTRQLASCLELAEPGHAIILIEDAVIAANPKAHCQDWLDRALAQHTLFALSSDITARGLSAKIHPDIHVVDYTGFVALTCQYDKVHTWS